MPNDTGKRLNTRASGVVAAAIMCSRILGLVREMLFAGLFGSQLMGLFIVAYRAPNLLRDLFAEGALSTAFITVFSAKIEREDKTAAWELAKKMFTLLAAFMACASVLGIVYARPIAGVLTFWSFPPENTETVVLLTRIMFPFILLVSLAALAKGMLNSVAVFGIPALASSFYNIGSIVAGTLIGYWLDPTFGRGALTGLAIGSLVGGALQFLVQVPSLYKAGFRFLPNFRWNDPRVRLIIGLMIPSVIAASAVQINVVVNSMFASSLGPQAVAWLNFAFRLMQMPLGVFGVAVATISLPVLARIAASESEQDRFGPTIGKALRLVVFYTFPAAVGLALLAQPIICLIYERWTFNATDTVQTAAALQCYALGLVFYSAIKVLSPAFYAINRRWTPMWVSFAAIGINLALNWFFTFRLGWGHQGLALATSLSAIFNFSTLYVLMRIYRGSMADRALLGSLVRCGLAVAAMAGACWAGISWGGQWIFSEGFIPRFISLFTLIGVSVVIYIVVCWLLRVEEIHDALEFLKRKLRRNDT